MGVALFVPQRFKPGCSDESERASCEMASIRQASLKPVKAALPLRDRGVGGDTVLEEVELTTWLQNPIHLAQGFDRVGNRAEGECAEGAVAT